MAAALIFAVLFVGALGIAPAPPTIDKPGTDVVRYLSTHSAELRLQALLVTLGSLALVVVLGYTRSRLDGPAGYVFTIGSAVLLAEVGVYTWFISGLALSGGSLNTDIARSLVDVTSMWGPTLTVADVMVAAPIVLAARAGRFPRWLGALGAIFALEQLIETITIVGGPGEFISPGGPMNLYVGGALFIVFFLALGIAQVSPSPGQADN